MNVMPTLPTPYAFEALLYFAVSSGGTQHSEERKSFSRKAYSWIKAASEIRTKSKIVEKYADPQEEFKVRNKQYDLVLDAMAHPEDHAHHDRLKSALMEEAEESLKLASELHSLYKYENSLIVDLMEREVVSESPSGGDAIDSYCLSAVPHLYNVTREVMDPIYTIWVRTADVRRHVYSEIDPNVGGGLEKYGKQLKEDELTNTALLAVIYDLCYKPSAVKITKTELDLKVQHMKEAISEKRNKASITAQAGERLLHPPTEMYG